MTGGSPHVRLANDIAAQFHGVRPERAAGEIAAHIRSFWEPRMIAGLVRDGDDGSLDPLVLDALALLP